MLKYIKEGLLNLVFPLNCKVCGKFIRESMGYSICKECLNKIKLIDVPYCKKCGKPLIKTEYFMLHDDNLCANCKSHDFHFDFARSVGVFDKTLKICIHLFKYYHEKKLAKPLGRILVDYLIRNKVTFQGVDLIIPVPLHIKKLKSRGFNQSDLLAEEIGSHFSIPVEREILVKRKMTASQVNLSRKERCTNLNRAFQIKETRKLKEKNIILVDDVFTTGSTVSECSRELKEAQAKNVYVLTLARGML